MVFDIWHVARLFCSCCYGAVDVVCPPVLWPWIPMKEEIASVQLCARLFCFAVFVCRLCVRSRAAPGL